MRCPGASVLSLSPPLVALLFTRLAIRSGQSHPGFYTQPHQPGNGRRSKSHRPRAIRPLGRYGGARAIRDSPSDVGACHRVVRRHTCSSPVTRRSMRATQARDSGGETPTMLGGLLDVSGPFSEGKPDLSRLSNQLMCRRCRRWCAVPRHRTKHLEGPAGRAQIGGHDNLSFMTSAPQHHGAFWHFPPKRARSLKARANHATHPTPRARESIGYVSVIINHVTFNENMRVVAVFVFVDLSWHRWLCAKKSRRGTAIDKKMTGGRRGRERGAHGGAGGRA